MKKIILSALALASVATAFAGGINTNTNQNAAFLRQMSQDAIIDITGLYANPAGTAFLTPGSHFSINIQNAKQTREIETTFPFFALNTNTPGETSHNFKGEAYAPVIPSIHYSYNWEKWSINASFSLTGGGGKCEFDKGLGSFEALYASQMYQLVPAMVTPMVMGNVKAGLVGNGLPETTADALIAAGDFQSQLSGYSLNAYMKGKQYYFGLQLGTTYKALDNLAVFAGVRAVYANCNYNGFVQNINAHYAYSYNVPMPGGMPALTGGDNGSTSLADRELALNADQTGFGFTPMIGVDWKINEHWNLAAKYEFKTRMRLENKSEMNEFASATAATNATLGQFADGSKIAADIPSVLFAGVQYSPIQSVRLNAGYHLYGDKKATQYGNKQDLIDDNTFEITAGAEWDVCKLITLSCSYQTTKYGLSDAHMNDLSFVVDSWSYGLGARVNCTEKLSLDLGFMHTLYEDRTVELQPAPGVTKKDVYTRTNRVLGIGLNYNF